MRAWRVIFVTLIGLLVTNDAAAASSPKTLAAGPLNFKQSSFENTKRFLRKESAESSGVIDEERGLKGTLEAARISLLKLKIPGWLAAGKDQTDVIKILKMTYPYVDDKNWKVLKSFQKAHSKLQHSLYPVGK
ncbi:hypothetical protein F441_17241 [Phytophthora nicotianae CJ01A1]|uniref:RxLR effector protein n=3 Tax=Phytophthora nicotianae TaxID=4792 RepID=W2R0T8_PHYN3|nr:hypothetical protein PPTG_03821 [Phytophthora nicotianae INRA-310]ETK76771.1 hypothetical protein L915_16889 [Phytophthora nicotianae]ETL30199.1 hypothetical protein L916_16793 [Phytophthora nicotianae]ETN18125.1 hypothetical protein PPTG_03821 [Phytophthora nicotianae INRA-310]ETP06387.1 hypothetical protein F441_17241 [Phytophthora nicotianae CJ01A1]